MKVLAALLRERYELSKSITSEVVLESFLFSSEGKLRVLKRLGGLSGASYTVLLSNLRKAGILGKDNSISRKVIPSLGFDGDKFTFTILFDIKGDDNIEGKGDTVEV
jgi:hypothetical protein